MDNEADKETISLMASYRRGFSDCENLILLVIDEIQSKGGTLDDLSDLIKKKKNLTNNMEA